MITIASVLVLAWLVLLVGIAVAGGSSNAMGSRLERALASEEQLVTVVRRDEIVARAA